MSQYINPQIIKFTVLVQGQHTLFYTYNRIYVTATEIMKQEHANEFLLQ
jgi:hypothetical protein